MKKLFLVSLGPGDSNMLTPQAKLALRESQCIVGYSLYLKLLEPIINQKHCHTFPLGKEVERAQLALRLASEGNITSLISSGDIGIYAMASLVFELLDQQQSKTPEWIDVSIEVIPGISALLAGSSRVGAILGHDFCTISLSDLLTPWQVIEKRLHSVGQGDFVVAIYNPISKQRFWQLNKAQEILLQYRSSQTPVVVAKNIARDNELITITTLEELQPDQVDMLTLVIIGNSESKKFFQNSKQWVYTPRGYVTRTNRL